MELVTSDKLDRLKSICSEKLERIRILQEAYLENEEFLVKERNSIIPLTALNNLKLELAQRHVKLAQLTEAIAIEEKKKQRLLNSNERLAAMKEEAVQTLQKLGAQVSPYKSEVATFSKGEEVFVNQLQENCLMMKEELRSWMMSEETSKDDNFDWQRKVVAATHIQRQQAEKELTELEKEYFDLTNELK